MLSKNLLMVRWLQCFQSKVNSSLSHVYQGLENRTGLGLLERNQFNWCSFSESDQRNKIHSFLRWWVVLKPTHAAALTLLRPSPLDSPVKTGSFQWLARVLYFWLSTNHGWDRSGRMVRIGNNMHTESNIGFLKVYLRFYLFFVETFEITETW